MMRGLEHLSYEERLRVGAVQPVEDKAPRRPYGSFSVLKEKMGTNIFTGPVATGQGVMV